MKKVYKYGTDQEIPEGAVYLCTKTETVTEERDGHSVKRNLLVWHYFLVEVDEK